MTNDKLLAKINANLCEKEGCDSEHYKKDGLNAEWFALRAVVELHTNTEDGYCAWCYLCNYDRTGLSMDSAMYAYPCPTIQAIEKELQ